jgi:hypothetical protein
MATKKGYDSISDWLTDIGFTADLHNQKFSRYPMTIPFEELSGHTVRTFQRKAVNKGWVHEDETKYKEKSPA